MSLVYDSPKTTNTERFAVKAFLKALGATTLAEKVRECEPADLDDAVKHAKRFKSYSFCNKVTSDGKQAHYNNDGVRVRAVFPSNRNGGKAFTNVITPPNANDVVNAGHSEAEYQALPNELWAFRASQQSAPSMLPPNVNQFPFQGSTAQ